MKARAFSLSTELNGRHHDAIASMWNSRNALMTICFQDPGFTFQIIDGQFSRGWSYTHDSAKPARRLPRAAHRSGRFAVRYYTCVLFPRVPVVLSIAFLSAGCLLVHELAHAF